MEKAKIIDLAKQAAKREVSKALGYLRNLKTLNPKTPWREVLESGRTADVEICLERAQEWLEAVEEAENIAPDAFEVVLTDPSGQSTGIDS